jgi:sensor c-di-GMP phosphodiesterase-like protein
VITHIVELAATLDLEIIAEGVETEDQVRNLRKLRIQYAQGWFFARPMSFSNLLHALENGAERNPGAGVA